MGCLPIDRVFRIISVKSNKHHKGITNIENKFDKKKSSERTLSNIFNYFRILKCQTTGVDNVPKIWSNVDFPAPNAPIIDTTSDLSTWKSTPLRTLRFPKDFSIPLAWMIMIQNFLCFSWKSKTVRRHTYRGGQTMDFEYFLSKITDFFKKVLRISKKGITLQSFPMRRLERAIVRKGLRG